jgi:cytochrome c oxidase subunit 1
MGTAYWLVPRVSGRSLELRLLARVQPYLWFLGMLLFSIANHITGLMGLPRRVFATNYGGAAQAQPWEGLTLVSALGGIVLFASASMFVLVMIGTLLAGPREEQPKIVWAESLDQDAHPSRPGIWDRLWLWWAVAAVLVVIAYGVPLWNLLRMTRYGSPGFRPF